MEAIPGGGGGPPAPPPPGGGGGFMPGGGGGPPIVGGGGGPPIMGGGGGGPPIVGGGGGPPNKGGGGGGGPIPGGGGGAIVLSFGVSSLGRRAWIGGGTSRRSAESLLSLGERLCGEETVMEPDLRASFLSVSVERWTDSDALLALPVISTPAFDDSPSPFGTPPSFLMSSSFWRSCALSF